MLFWYVKVISKLEYLLEKIDVLQNLGYLFYLLLMDKEKSVIFSVHSVYSLCNKIEEPSWKLIRNSNQIIFCYCVIILGFPFVNCLS